MLTNLDPSSEVFLADMNRVQERLRNASRQVSSGKKLTVASDAPDQVAPLLQLRAILARNTQIQQNLSMAKANAESADAALTASTKLLDRALSLATQGANFTEESGRQALAMEVESLESQMVAYSRTAVDGRFIFSGDDRNPAYQLDLTAATGVVRLSGAPVTRTVEDPAGGSFLAGMSAQEIFDHRNSDDTVPSDNVFAALDNLRLALLNNDTAGIQASVGSIEAASSHLNNALSFYGSVQTRISDATDYAASYATRIQAQIGDKEDADVAAAALELSQANSHLQAAFQMHANMPKRSLFDYMG